MKKTFCMVIAALVLMVCIPANGFSATIPHYESAYISGVELKILDFETGTEPLIYTATIRDLSWEYLNFDYLDLNISTLEDGSLGTVGNIAGGAGSLSFTVDPGQTFTASILGIATGGDGMIGNDLVEIGLYAMEIKASAVPLPATLLLLGSGLVALTALKRRRQ